MKLRKFITYSRVYRCLIVLLVVCSFSNLANSQTTIPTKGTEFWVGFLENYEVTPATERLDLFVTSSVNTTGTVELPLQGWSVDFDVVANVTTVVNIPNNIAEHIGENEIVSNKGVLVQTADTVSLFAINYKPNTSDGTKVLPTKALGTEYRVASYVGLNDVYGSSLLIVATEDDTEIEITPSEDTPNGNLAGVPFTIQLDRAESYSINLDIQDTDLTGTLIKATESSGDCKPFAVFSGASCANIPNSCGACDHVFEQNFAADTWGSEYYIVPYEFSNSYTYRVLAHEDNTQVFIDGLNSFTLNSGEYQEFNSQSDPLCIQTSNPAAVVQYMEGTNCSGNGDPSMLILNDATKKISNVSFSTVVSDVIDDHGINVVMATDDVGTFSIDGAFIDVSEFSVFTSCPSHSYAQLTVTEGSHTLDAPNGFTAYSFGLGEAESYSYSVGSFSTVPFSDLDIEELFCTNDEVVLQPEELGFNLYWYNLDHPEDTLGTDSELVLEVPLTGGIYAANYDNLISGCQVEELFSVEVPEPPNLDNITQSHTICQFESTQLNVTPNPASDFYLYSWSPTLGLDNSSIANPVASPLVTTTYEVTVSTFSGCGVGTEQVTITVDEGSFSNIVATADVLEICSGETVQLDVNISETTFEDNFDPGISWGLWEDIENGSQSDDCGSVSGSALYFNGAGDRSAETIPIDVSTGGAVSFALQYGDGVFPCDQPQAGEDVVLEYSLNATTWILIETIFVLSINGLEQFNVEIPPAAMSAATSFRWRQVNNSGNNQDNWYIDNVSVSIISVQDLDFSWSPVADLDQSDISSPLATPLQDVTFLVELTDASTGCVYLDSVSIEVGQSFLLTLTPDTALCDVQGIQLDAIPDIDGDYSFEWTPNDATISGAFTDNPIVTPIEDTTYEITVTSAEGCVNMGEVTIYVNELLDLSVTADESTLCFGDQTILHATIAGNPDGLEYEWNPDSTISDVNNPNPSVTPVADTTYEILVTDGDTGCSLNESIDIEIIGNFEVGLGEDIEVCNASGLEIEAVTNVPGTYVWNWETSLDISQTNASVTELLNNEGGQLIAFATEGNCVQSDTLEVSILFEDFTLGPDFEICLGEDSIISTGLVGYGHVWNTGATENQITASTEQLYQVDITSPDGCEVSDDIFVMVLSLPLVGLGADVQVCDGEEVVLNALNPGFSYMWNTFQTSQIIMITSPGIYEVEVTDDNNCSNSDEVSVVFNSLPENILPADTTLCFVTHQEPFILDAFNDSSLYDWSTGETTPSIQIYESGLYSVNVTTGLGCEQEFQASVEEICFGEYLFVPNSFTPNHDGINDVWNVEGVFVEEFEVKVFDRWGEEVFYSNDIVDSWNGNDQNGDHYVPAGVYTYQIRFKYISTDQGVISSWTLKQGQVTVVR